MYITLSDEERAAQRLREHLNGPAKREADRERWGDEGQGTPKLEPEPFSEQERFVIACIRVAKQHSLNPATVARKARGWTPQAWGEAYRAFQFTQTVRHNTTVAVETYVRDNADSFLSLQMVI